MSFNEYISVEIPLFLVYTNYLLTSTLFTNLVVYRTCYIILDYNKTACAEIGNDDSNITERLNKLVVPTADVIVMGKNIVDSVFPVFVCMIAGSWSDKFGRKPVLLMSLMGLTAGSALMVIFATFDVLNPWYFLTASIPSMLTGGSTTYSAATLSYISDVSTTETRGLRMACYEVALACGVLLGTLSSSYIFYATNYETVFAIGFGCMLLSLIYTIFFIPESLSSKKARGIANVQYVEVENKNILQVQYLKDMVFTTLKYRENYNRALVILTILSIILVTFTVTGDSSIQYIFLSEKFNWTLTKFNLFNGGYYILWIVGTMGGTFFLQNRLKIRNTLLGLVGLGSFLCSFVLILLAKSDLAVYSSGVVKCLGGMVAPMLRSFIAHLVPADEMGKIFSVIVGCGSLLALGASPLYTLVYNATINVNGALYNIISIILIGSAMVFVTIMTFLENRYTYSPIGSDSERSLITAEPESPVISVES